MRLSKDDETASLLAAKEELEEAFRDDIWRWLCQSVYTVDESSISVYPGKTHSRILPWPKHLTYLREVLAILQGEPLIIIPKSRRMMISWLIAAYFVWTARYQGNAALFWQSETEKKAAYIVDKRCHFIETHLQPPEFRQEVKTIKTKDSLIGQMTYPNDSYIWAVPQGGDVLRAYTATKVMMDECEFQPQSPDALRALLPLVEKGAQAILVSSSNGPIGVMAEICRQVGFSGWSDLSRLQAA